MRGHGLLELCSPSLLRCCGRRTKGTSAQAGWQWQSMQSARRAGGRSGGAFACSRTLLTGRESSDGQRHAGLLASVLQAASSSLSQQRGRIEASLRFRASGAGRRAQLHGSRRCCNRDRNRAHHALRHKEVHRRGHYTLPRQRGAHSRPTSTPPLRRRRVVDICVTRCS